MSKMYSILNKYLNFIVLVIVILNLLILVIIDIPVIDIIEEIFRTSSLKDILNRIFYTLLVLVVFKIYLTCLHFRCLKLLKELQENQNKRGLTMSDLHKEAESLVDSLFGQNVVDQRFNSSNKLEGASSVMSEMAKEKQGTYDIASTLLDKQFKLKNAETQQALRTHIINLSNGVDVKLQESELKSLVQLTGKSEEELLEEFPNLKLADNTSESEEKLDNESTVQELVLLSDNDSTFLLSNILCHDNVVRTLQGLNVDTEHLRVEVFTTQVCKAIVKTLLNVKVNIEDQSSLIRCVELLHFIVARNEDLSDQQLKVFTDIVRSFYEQPAPAGDLNGEEINNPEPEQKQDDSDLNDGIKRYLSNEEECFVKGTIEECRSLMNECNLLKIGLDKPIDFDSIGLVNIEKISLLTRQMKNQNKQVPKYAKLEVLLLKVIDQMKA